MLGRLTNFLSVLATTLVVVVGAEAEWVEKAGAGGPTTGTLTGGRGSNTSEIIAGAVPASSNVNFLWSWDGTTRTNFNGPTWPAGTDDYSWVGVVNAGGGDNVYIGGQNNPGFPQEGYHGWASFANAKAGSWNTQRTGASIQGREYGYANGMTINSGDSRWILSGSDSATRTRLSWRGVPNLASDATSNRNIRTTQDVLRYDVGLAWDGDVGVDVDAGGFAVSGFTGGTGILISRLTDGQTTHRNSTRGWPTGWVANQDFQVQQCFGLGTKSVGVIYNATQNETWVGVYSGSSSITADVNQIISGKVVGGASVDGTAYIMKTDGTLYTSDGTTDFADASDSLAATPLWVARSPDGTAAEVWATDGKIYQLSAAGGGGGAAARPTSLSPSTAPSVGSSAAASF